MKKFMIFLLMAFLYLGTCQARSEATHLNGANDKLHSWVTPSTLLGSPLDMDMFSGDVPSGTPIHTISPSQPQNLCLTCPHNKAVFASNWNANGYKLQDADGYYYTPDLTSRRWYVNNMPTDSMGAIFTFTGYPVGQYSVKCVVEYVTTHNNTVHSVNIQSNSVIVTVVNDFTVNIVGPDHACQNDQVTLSAVVSDASLPVTYQWRRDGQYIVGAESSSYEFMVSNLPGLTDTLVHEFDVQVTSQAGPGGIGSCDTKYSPVHYFSVSPVPVTLVDVPLFCNNASSVTVTTSSYTSGGEQPYMWKWTKVGSTDTATTYVNYFTIDNPVSGEQYKVMPIYQDFACNADTALFELKSYKEEFGITAALKNITLEGAPDLVCLGGMTTLTVTDNNPTSNPGIGEATYTWYMNGTLIEGVTGKTYTTELSTTGEYAFAVVASYANYPCETPQAFDTVKVDSVATSVTLTGGNVLCENPDGTFTSTLITAHVTPTTGTFEYMWTGQTAFSTDNTFTVNTPGVYNVIVRSAAGCETASMPFEVTGFGADVQVTAVITNACAGEPVVLNANAAGWTGSIAYTWNTGSHSPSIIVTPIVDSVFTVTSTATMGANATCSRTDTFKVVILPAIAVKPILAVALDSVCVGSLASVYVANDATVGAYTYQWYMDGVEIPGQNLDSISVAMATPGIHTFTARPLSVNGCISDSISAPVTVKVKDAVHYITITGDNVLCEMTDSTFSHTTLTANVAPINLSYKYKWNTQTEFSNNNTLTVETPGVYTVTVKTMEGCEVVSEPFNVTGFGANVLISSTETSCPGEPVTLSASSQGWTGSISYAWEGIPGNYPTVTVFPKRDTTYKVTTTVIMESGVSCSRVDSIHVYVLPIATVPTVAVVGVDSICEGSLANLAVTNHVNGAYYVWYQNGVVIPGHNLDSISVVLETPGVYEFTAAVVTANGCTTPDSEIPAVVTVKAIPTLVNITGNNVICEDDSTVLTAHVSGEITNPTYKWSTGSTLDSIKVPAGVYTVTVTNGQMTGCAATAEYVVTSFGSDVMLTASSQHVCAGADVILNISFDGWVSDNMSHAWVDPDGNAMPGSSQVTASPAKEGWYKVTSTATSTSGTCSRLDSIYVNVDTLHVTDLALTSPYDTICLGAQASFKAVCPGADRFVWYENGVVIPGQNLDSIVVMPQAAGSYTYSVAGINTITGCVSEDTTLLPALLVLDNPSMMISGDAIVCDTTMVELYAHINDTTYAHDNFNYVWRVYNDTLTPDIDSIYNWQAGEWQVILTDMTGAPANHGILMTDEFTPQDEPYVIMVQATNERGCVATSDLFYLYIGASPTVAVTIDHDTICEGGLVTATAHLGNYNMNNLVYQWYEKNKVTGVIDTVAHGTSRIYTTYVDTSVVIGVRVTQTTTECSIYGEDSVFVLPVKLQKIIASNETHNSETDTLNVCKGEGVYLTAYVSNEETGLVYVDSSFTYVWYENGFLMPGVTGPTFHKQMDIQDDDTLSYQYTAYIDFGVEGCEPKLVSSNVVFVKRNPIVTIAGHHNVCYYGSYTETHTYNIHLIAWVDGDYDPNMTYTWYEHNQLRYNVGGSIYDNHYRENWVPTYDNPYSFTVEVADSDGCVTISEPFEVNVYNKPDVNITATETTICKGGETELTAHLNNYNDPNLIYQWYIEGTDPNNAIPGMTEPTETYVVDTTTTYLVKVTHLLENGSLTAQACFNVASIVITANDIPVIDSVTTDLAEGNDTICEGRYVTFTAHISKGVQGGELYTWYRNGEVIATTPDPVYRETPQALNGDITVWDYAVKVTQAASGCESEIKGADTITVFPNPVLVLVTDPIVCDTLENNIVMYANVTPAPTSTYSFTWYQDNQVLADGTMMGSHNDSIKLTRPYSDNAYNFSVELVNEYGCATRDDAIVYVHDNPVVHATVTENNICLGGEITLTANLDDYNAEMLEFHWYDNGVLIGTATELTYTTVPGLGEHNYNMTAYQRNSDCIASSDIVTVTVYDDPVITSVTTDLAEGNDTICEGRFVTLTAHISGGVRGGEVYTWYRNGQVIPGAVDSVYQETPQAINGDPTTYDYTVTVRQTAAGCESNANGYNTITVLPNPVLVLVTDPIVCDTLTNNIVMYANVTPAPTSTYSFTWYQDNQVLADGTLMGSHNDSIKLTRPYSDNAYNFSVELVNEYGCTTSDDAIVYVHDNPVVHAVSSDYIICKGGEITLTANLDDYNAEMLEFHWYDNGVLIPTATELTYTVVPSEIPSTHRYTMTAFQRNSHCIATSDEVVVIVNPDPIIDRVVLSDYIACEGAQVRVEAIPDNYVASSTDVYTWYRNGIRIPGATNRVLYDTPTTVDQNTQQFIYTAVVTLEQPGCTSLPVSAEALTIYRNPVVAITGDQHVCETNYTFLIANVDTIGQSVGNLHYTWYVDGMVRPNTAYNLGDSRFFAELLYPRDEAYIVTVNVEREDVANACASMSAPYEVYVYPKPDVDITANVSDICVNGEVTLQANLRDWNADHITFQWYEIRTVTDSIAIDYLPGGGYIYDVVTTQYQYNIPGATGFRYTTTLAETTTLGVKVLQTNSQCYDTDEFTVTVHATPAAPIITVNNPMICSNGDARLTVTNDYSEYGTPVYAWMKDGVLIPGAHDYYYDHQPGQNSGTTYTYNAIVTFEMPGCTSAISDNADVVVIPDPAVTVTVDGPTTICVGGEVTFSANAQPTTLDYTYQWYDYNNQLMDGETASTLTVSPAANQQNYNYKVVVNSLPGCQIVVDAPVVTVIADPVVTLSIDNPVICQGGTSTLYVNVEGGISNVNGIAPYVYNWYNNLSTETPFATTTENFYVLPANQATDSFAYWVEVSADAYGCASTSNNINQLVVADPIVNILVAPTYPETVCDGGNTMLVASVQGGFGDNSYQWYRNETILVGETNPTLNTGILSVNDLNSYRVIVTQTGSDCETASDTFAVPVIPSYNVVVSALNNATVCEGGTTTMEATITNEILANDNPTFQWYEIIDGANVAISGANSTRYTTSPLLTDGNHTYFVAVNSQVTGSGCSAHSNSFYTAIVDDPTVVVSTTAVNNVVCEGDVVRVNATVTPADGDYTYNWTWTNGTNTYSFTNNEPTFAPTELPASTNGYLFNVSIVSADPNSGCNATSNSNVYVTVMPRPVITISADNAVVCAGGHVELTANHNASDYTGYNYAWTVNGQTMPSTLQTITVPAYMVTDGNINASVVVTSSQLTLNCSSTATLTEPVQVVAQPTVSAAADYLTMCEGAAPVLTATVNSNASNAALTYQWQVGGNTINGASGNVYQSAPLAAGTYNFKVRVMSENSALNCQSDWSDAVVVRVAETPVIGITSADGLALCEGGNITLTATVLNANNMVGNFTNGSIYGAYNYVWMNNNNTVAANNNISLPQNQITETLNNVGNYNYTVYVTPVGTLANGCGVVISEPLQVVVNARPNWDAAVVYPASGNICLGEEVQLHAHITGGVTDMNGNTNGHIQWVVEYNGVASNVSNYGGDATHTPTLAGVYTYYPTYIPYEGSILGSGCAFTNSDQVSTFLTVHELPTAAFVSGDGTTLCSNVSDHNAALTIHFTGTAPFHFTVTDLSTGSSTMYDSYTNDYTIYVSPEYTTQYRITFLSDNYCDNGELGLDAIATVFVNDITFNQKLFVAECGTNEVTINFNMASGTANSDFAVVYANGLVVTGQIVNGTATFATPEYPGDYDAIFFVGGCEYPIIVRRPVADTEFTDGTVPFMMQRWDDVVVINNNPATNGGHTFVSYQWYKNGELIEGAIYPNYQEKGGLNGYYSIEVTSLNEDGTVMTYTTCEQYFAGNSAIKVYPVPANVQQVVTIELNIPVEDLEGATLDIYNVTGALVDHITKVEPVTRVAGFKAAGTYFGHIMMANGETKTVKFVIVK